MTNTGKALIIGLVLIDLGVVGYLLVPRGERTTAANGATGGAVETRSVSVAVVGPRASDTHVVAGSVLPTAPSSAQGSGEIAAVAPLPPPRKPNAHAVKPATVNGLGETKTTAPQTAESAQGDINRQGSNPVAAAMTDALVKESAKPDPSLPMPTAPMQSAPTSEPPAARDGQTPRGSNPVAAAMTQELVKQSARVDSASQPPARSGTQ
ncbi:hypothetical protein [Paraburkholderia sp. BL21I4N1]|uniref:hypothetical protein n=1 Tax=Paraburkholderia sp. BL21I4N1 TaxID=1938801 RepID=UPI000CFDF428|nr:hypothetical protein [Paraburkholderia sp. BL21I4N1]PQV54205.1 hypothetical protein B0G83_101387 [Paraburkholderia sp. BL21I4N1]